MLGDAVIPSHSIWEFLCKEQWYIIFSYINHLYGNNQRIPGSINLVKLLCHQNNSLLDENTQ